MGLLETLTLPDELADLTPTQFRELAAELRAVIIHTVASNGGHLGASLGVVELSLALHAELDSPKDKIIWDVGHQAYAHKLLTGRYRDFSTIRTHGGLSGFPKRSESDHDAFGAGHASTSISAAVGFAEAGRLQHDLDPGRVVAVIGDGALTGGMAYEGLNQAGHLRTPMVIVLNDNDMSIQENVGALSSYLTRLRADPGFSRFRHDLERRVQRLPRIGEHVASVGEHLKDGMKAALVPGMLFEELGFTYIGVIDGHDIGSLRQHLRRALALQSPVVLHVKTTKGKGYVPAEDEPDRFHGTPPFSVSTGKTVSGSRKPISYTDAFGRALLQLATDDERVVAITAAMSAGTGMDPMARAFPERFYDVGIAEEHAVGFAAGLAAAGLRPVVAIYSTFMQRAYDQLIHDVCLQELPVIFALDRAGLVGEDGPTHHGAFDLSFLRVVPNLTILVPKDEAELQRLLATALTLDGPVALRYPRGSGAGVPLPDPLTPIDGPWIEVLREGREVLLLGIGTGVARCLAGAEILEERGCAATVANVRRLRPLDEDTLISLAADHDVVVTVEENVLAGGFGSAVLEALQRGGLLQPVRRVGLPDAFVAQGDLPSLYREVGFTGERVAKEALAALPAAATRD